MHSIIKVLIVTKCNENSITIKQTTFQICLSKYKFNHKKKFVSELQKTRNK